MSAYRFVDPNPVIFNLLGLESAPFGSLTFYEKGTTDPKDTWSDQALSVENENPVELDAAGRAETEIWLDGEYTVLARAEDGSTIWTRDVVPEIAPGLAIPSLAGNTGFYLSNDGSSLIWVSRLDLPDPSGSAGYQVVVNSDGTGYILQPIAEPPEPPDPEYTITSDHIKIGTLLIQWGTDTVPAAPSAKSANKAVTFDEEFSGTPYIVLPVNTSAGGSAPSGAIPTLAVTSLSATGCTVTANIPDDDSNTNWKLGNSTPFSYLVVGPTTA